MNIDTREPDDRSPGGADLPPALSSVIPPSVPQSSSADLAALLKQQQALVAMGRRAIAPPETAILLQDAAALIADMLGVESSAVVEFSPDGSTLFTRLAWKQPDGAKPRFVTRALTNSADESLAAYALQVARPVVVDDLPTEGRFQDRFLRGYGIRSALAMPLRLLNRAFGVLIAGSTEPQRFDPRDMPFAEAIGHLAGTTVARTQAENDCAESQSFMQGLLQTVEALVLILGAEGQILRINETCERVTGFSLADLRERPLWNSFAAPSEAELYRTMFERLRQGEFHVACETFLWTKHAQQRRIRWSCGVIPAARGRAKTFLATGMDITEHYLSKQAVFSAEPAAGLAPAAAEPMPIVSPEGRRSQLLSADDAFASSPGDGLVVPLSTVPRERRRQSRRPYPYRQKVAPIVNGQLPSRRLFREVLCHDIAAGGIGFLLESPPESDAYVIALGSQPRLTYLIARVAHVTPLVRDGNQVYKIGCKYTGRAPQLPSV